jgi:hypothetical protein
VVPDVVRFLAAQVGVDAALFAQYGWEGRTIEAHRAQIREMTKIRECRRADEEALLDWLCAEIFDHEQHPDRLRELIRAECRTRAIEAPDDIAALVDSGLMAYEAQVYTVIAARLAPEVQKRLDALLVAEPEASEEEELPLSLLRHDPGPVGVESALAEIAKLRALRAIELPPDLFEGYTPKLIERLRRRIAAESPSHIREHPLAIRMTLLAALVFQRTQEVTDALVTLLIQIVHRIGTRAERRVEACAGYMEYPFHVASTGDEETTHSLRSDEPARNYGGTALAVTFWRDWSPVSILMHTAKSGLTSWLSILFSIFSARKELGGEAGGLCKGGGQGPGKQEPYFYGLLQKSPGLARELGPWEIPPGLLALYSV